METPIKVNVWVIVKKCLEDGIDIGLQVEGCGMTFEAQKQMMEILSLKKNYEALKEDLVESIMFRFSKMFDDPFLQRFGDEDPNY